eukprot:163496-Pleurochrysis_carterae.AAC.1
MALLAHFTNLRPRPSWAILHIMSSSALRKAITPWLLRGGLTLEVMEYSILRTWELVTSVTALFDTHPTYTRQVTDTSLVGSYYLDEADTRLVGLVLYGRSNRKSVGSPEAVPLRSAPSTSGVVNIQMIMR